MRRHFARSLKAAALLPFLATCSQPQPETAAEALSAEQLRAEARLVAFLIEGAVR